MNATFAPSMPPFGRAAFVSQSGALGLERAGLRRRVRHRDLAVRLDGQQAGRQRQRSAGSVGERSAGRRDPHVRRELRQPAALPRDRLADHPRQADHRGEVGAVARRRARGELAYRRPGGQRRRGGRAPGPGRSAPGRLGRGAVRPGDDLQRPAAAAVAADGGAHQFRRARHPGRRCARGPGRRSHRARPLDGRHPQAALPRRGLDPEPGGHDRDRQPRRLSCRH